MSLQLGDSKERVLQIMGEPGDRQFRGDNEALQFCTQKWALYIPTSAEFTVVWFYRGRLTGVTSYANQGALCQGGYRTLQWADAPSPPSAGPGTP
jgi:hypothetical protein